MAYVKKEDLVIFNLESGKLQALVTDIQFRRFRKSYKDKKTGETKSWSVEVAQPLEIAKPKSQPA